MEKTNQLEDLMLILEQLSCDYDNFPDKVHHISTKYKRLQAIIQESNSFFENLQIVIEASGIETLYCVLEQIVKKHQQIVLKEDGMFKHLGKEIKNTFGVKFELSKENVDASLNNFLKFFFEVSDSLYRLRDLQYPNTLGSREREYFGRNLSLHMKIQRIQYSLEDLSILCDDIKKKY